MRGEDVHEGGGGVCRRCRRVDGAAAAQRRRQVEGGCWGSSVKSLLLKGLLRRKCQGQNKGWELSWQCAHPHLYTPQAQSQHVLQRTDKISSYGSFFPSPWLTDPKRKQSHCPVRLSQSLASPSPAMQEALTDTNLSFGVDGARDVWHTCITGCHRYTWGEGRGEC